MPSAGTVTCQPSPASLTYHEESKDPSPAISAPLSIPPAQSTHRKLTTRQEAFRIGGRVSRCRKSIRGSTDACTGPAALVVTLRMCFRKDSRPTTSQN